MAESKNSKGKKNTSAGSKRTPKAKAKTRTKKKSTVKNDKKKPFVIPAVIIALAIIIPVAIFITSVLLNEETQDNINTTLYPIKYERLVENACSEYDVEESLVYAVIRTESGFDPDAVSSAGAIGLMQLMPDTFTWLQNYRTKFMPDEILDSDELYDPSVNIDYGVFLLSYLMEHYDNNESLVICSYNAGYGNVDSWLEDGIISADDVRSEDIPFTETANYLEKVTSAKEMYISLYFSEDTEVY